MQDGFGTLAHPTAALIRLVLQEKPPDNSMARVAVSHNAQKVMMLITFSCPAYADITMFGDVATRLLKMMGHSGTVPSALLADDVPAALERLRAALAAAGESPAPEEASRTDDEETAVSLRHRALPLIELLQAAAKAECNVMWDSN